MSFFGKNIRKIRSIKKISQTEFARIFDISRASVGSYEEGRAEPKIEIISKVANHFSITLDELINKELTVNELYHFDVGTEPAFRPLEQSKTSIQTIPYLESSELMNIDTLDHLQADTTISIPLCKTTTRPHAILIQTNTFTSTPTNLKNNSTIIIDATATQNINPKTNYIIKTQDAIFISKLIILANNRFFLQSNTKNISIVHQDEIIYTYPIISYISNTTDVEDTNNVETINQQLTLLIKKLL